MLKKAGIVVATAAAGLLAVSPLAFAGDKGGHDHGHGSSVSDNNTNEIDGDNSSGIVNVSGNNVNVPIQACGNDVPVNVLGVQVTDIQADLVGALGLLGDAEAERSGQTGDSRDCAQASNSGDTQSASIDD